MTLKLSLYFAGPDLDRVVAQDRQVVAVEQGVAGDEFGVMKVALPFGLQGRNAVRRLFIQLS